MRRTAPIIFLILLITSFSNTKAQDWEAGVFLGASNYSGDLTENFYTVSETQPSVGLLGRYYISPKVSIQGALTYLRASGDDANYDDNAFRRKRNLSFKTNIYEASIRGEYNILPFVSNTESYNFAPYVFGGVALFQFNPQADFQGETVDLADFNTEGTDYSKLQLSLPFGVGVKYSIGDRWNVGFEVGVRKAFTDYLDDVSDEYADLDGRAAAIADRSDELSEFNNPQFSPGDTRGNPDNDDLYYNFGFTITKTFRSNECTGDFYE